MLIADSAIKVQIRSEGKLKTRRRFFTYNCSCCGVEIHITQRGLSKASGKCKACSTKTTGESNRLKPFESLYNFLVSKAIDRSIPLSLTYDEFLMFTRRRTCHYCDAAVVWHEYGFSCAGKSHRSAYNLDRVDSSDGYHLWNLVVCCGRCNFMKRDLISYDLFKKIGLVIREHEGR